MRMYTVLTRPSERDVCSDIKLIRDGFSWMAFLFSFLWALSQRLWLVALGIVGVDVILSLLAGAIGLDPIGQTVVALGFSCLVGFEADNLQRWTFRQRGYLETAVIAARDPDEAELRFLKYGQPLLMGARP
ncbi:MAG: DUF2628 domain-containing protein [Hyphomicrobiales bacterium]|nr:DUF2628 domain-containing protein [Hyphomicrobiales bacterium]